jgi:hypothetical protein
MTERLTLFSVAFRLHCTIIKPSGWIANQVFRFQRCSRLEAQDTEDQLEQIGHQDASLRRPPAASTPNRIFGTHNLNAIFNACATDFA